jgi:phage protein D
MAAVTYTLEVGGQSASQEMLAALRSVEVEDHADLADMARIRLAISVGPDGSDWTHLDGGPFTRLASVKVAAAIGSETPQPLIDGYVIDLRATFSPEPTGSVLEVVAMDATVLMSLEEKVRAWPDVSDSSIASTIFGEHGLTPDVEDTEPTRQEADATTIQRGSDMQLLRRLAERNGYECFVEVGAGGQTTAHFHPPRLEEEPQGVLNVNMGTATNVDEFKARNDMIAPTTAQARGLEVETQEGQPADVTEVGATRLGSDATVSSDRPRRVLLSGTGLSAGGELQTLAQAVVDRSAWAIAAEGTLNGAAYGRVLRAKRPVSVRGAGTELSGVYYVERVLHTFDAAGWTQSFRLRRNASGLTRRERFQESGAAAPQPAVRV